MKTMGRNRNRMTPIQVQMLVDILYENSEIASGKLSSSFSREERNKKWEAVATLLNSKGLGPEKTSDQWRKSWSDLKFAIRSKAAKIELAGGIDLMNKKLTNLEKRVLQLSGDVAAETSENSESKPLTGKLLLKKLEEDLIKTEEDLAKAMKKPNQIVLPISVSKVFQMPEGTHIKLPIVESVAAKQKTDEKNDDSCIETNNEDSTEINYIDYVELDNNGSDDDIVYDESDVDEENLNYPAKEPSSPPRKRKKVSCSVEKISIEAKPSTPEKNMPPESKSFISVFQRQIETQTAVLKEQTSLMKDIADSLRLIASSLHNS